MNLNTSQEGGAIQRYYQAIVDSQAPSSSSETYAKWALFSVTAPLASAFQQSNKDSVLKVQDSGEGDLADMIEDFNDGRIQFAYVKVKDPNSKLPKNVLIGWCGEGVPERTKGYFTSHLAAVSKIFHGYHVQITARSDRDLTPESIMRKVEDASGSKYSGESAPSATSKGPPPPMTSKPVFTPTQSAGGSRSFAAPTARSRGGTTNAADDENDGWGSSAPQVSRTTLEKVESAYKPTKVNMAELTSQKQEPSRFNAPSSKPAANPDVIGGGYQPVGKVDIAAIRAKAQDKQDDRPTTVKGAYEPVGKVDIAAIRARAQGSTGGDDALSPARTGGSARGPISPARTGASAQDGDESGPKSLADRSSAFTQSERLTSMPKPKVANRIPSSTGSFGGTKAPAPLGLGFGGPAPAIAPSTQVGKNFGNQGGKTPAQLWAEKRAASGNGPPPSSTSAASPVAAQKSGGFQSGYAGKKWGAVEIPKPGQAMPSSNDDAVTEEQSTQEEEESTGNVGAIRDRFKNAAPIGVGRPSAARQPSTFEDDEEQEEDSAPAPPPMNLASKPNAGAGARGVPIPGMAQGRPVPTPQHDEEDEAADEPVGLPVPPPPQPPRTPEPEEDDEDYGDVRSSSPIRVVQPVSRTKAPHEIEPAEQHTSAPAMPIRSLGMVAPHESELDEEPQEEDHDIARGAAQATAASTFGAEAAHHPTLGSSTSGKRAIAQFDYEKAEENELELHEGEKVINIEMVDDDWWMGENSRGEKGLFPSNYVELVEDDEEGSAAPPPPPPAPAQATSHAAPPAPAASKGPTATAQYDYEALEDNELSFPDGATITNVEFPDDDWWMGEFGGKKGLFPANYVVLDE